MQELRRQRGGTFLGPVVGVVIGLGVALGVALYVTKVPVTFVNKVLNRTADQDAQEQQKNKDWDPNAPLYGKNPARPGSTVTPKTEPGVPSASSPPAGESAKAAVNAQALPAATPGLGAPAATAEGQAAGLQGSNPGVSPQAGSDPIADLARSKGLVAAPAAALDPFTYYVQVGAFRNEPDAKAFVEKLLQAGFVANVSQRDQAGRPVFRVRLGPYQTRDEANAQRALLTEKSFETVMVRVQR